MKRCFNSTFVSSFLPFSFSHSNFPHVFIFFFSQYRNKANDTSESEDNERPIKSDNSDVSDSETGSDSPSEDEQPKRRGKPADTIIETSNPNRAKPTFQKASALSESSSSAPLSRREREAIEKERAKAAYWKAHLEGKTEQARADMARLALVRKQREEAAKKREEELKGIHDFLS